MSQSVLVLTGHHSWLKSISVVCSNYPLLLLLVSLFYAPHEIRNCSWHFKPKKIKRDKANRTNRHGSLWGSISESERERGRARELEQQLPAHGLQLFNRFSLALAENLSSDLLCPQDNIIARSQCQPPHQWRINYVNEALNVCLDIEKLREQCGKV